MGLALLWKPKGLGSQEALARFKREVLHFQSSRGKSEIGHTGTLDPFAEGVLLVAWQEGTKLLAPLQGLPKRYVAQMKFGATTETLDGTSAEVSPPNGDSHQKLDESFSDRAQVFLKSKIGSFDQIPPAYSAIHVNGQRAYDLARKGVNVELKSRPATIVGLEHLAFDAAQQLWTFRVDVAAGTYIRSLARDWGQELTGFPGYLRELRREAVGGFQMSAPESSPDSTAPQHHWKALKITDFESMFSVLQVSDVDANTLQSFGRWKARELEGLAPGKAILVLNPKGLCVGWLESDSQKIGRIFHQDPFQISS